MKKYLALYMAPVETFDKAMQSSPEEMKKGMEVWNAWMEQNKSALVDMGSPLGKVKKVTKEGVTDHRNTLGGYSIVEAASLDEAAGLFTEDHPHFMMDDAWIEVVEFGEMPEM